MNRKTRSTTHYQKQMQKNQVMFKRKSNKQRSSVQNEQIKNSSEIKRKSQRLLQKKRIDYEENLLTIERNQNSRSKSVKSHKTRQSDQPKAEEKYQKTSKQKQKRIKRKGSPFNPPIRQTNKKSHERRSPQIKKLPRIPQNSETNHKVKQNPHLKSSLSKKFQHSYISSTTPFAAQILNNSTQIHLHTDLTKKNHSQSAVYIEYRMNFRLLNYRKPTHQRILQTTVHQPEEQLDRQFNVWLKIQWRYLQQKQISSLRREAESKKKQKSLRKKSFTRLDNKQRKKQFDGCTQKILNSRHIPEFMQRHVQQLADQSPQRIRSAFKPVPLISIQSQSTIKLFYFLWKNRNGISVGRSLNCARGRQLRLISYLKIDPSNNYPPQEQDQMGYVCRQTVYIPFNFEKDLTGITGKNCEQLNSDSQKKLRMTKKNYNIGTVQFSPQIPKNIFERIKNNETLRSQFYVNQITIGSQLSHKRSVFENDISTRHPVNFGELLKHLTKVKVDSCVMKEGAQIFLREIQNNLTFTKLRNLRLGELAVLEPLQFIQFESLEIIDFEGNCMYNLRSLKKLNLKTPLKRLVINKPFSLLQRLLHLDLVIHRKQHPYTFSHINSLPQINFHPDIVYRNSFDNLVPLSMMARLGSSSIFMEEDTEMMSGFHEYNDLYNKESEIYMVVNELLDMMHAR